MNGTGAWQHTNVFAAGMLVATYDNRGLHYQLSDALNTRRVQTTSNGVVEQSYISLPYGEMPVGQALGATEHHFTGKEHDQESGNDYFGARYYESSMGRFLTPDWSAKEDPVPYAKLDNPQSLNLYSYVWNNPLSRTDLDGHQCDWCKKALGWLTSSHSASVGTTGSVSNDAERSGPLTTNAKAITGTASASASYGANTGASAKVSGSVAEATVNEGTHSTTQMNGVTANAGASVSAGVNGVSASAGANADALTASQTEKVSLGSVTITGSASGAVGVGANISFQFGPSGISYSEGAALGYGGGWSLSISWGGVAATGGASVKGTVDSTTTTINKPEVQPQ